MKICGIYTITNLVNGKIYVGYTTDYNNRAKTHLKRLRGKYHPNPHLDEAVQLYGYSNFIIELLEECGEDLLCALEHYWATILNVHNPKFGYNIMPTHPYVKNCRNSKETRQKISISNTGRKATLEQKENMSKAQKNRKWTLEQKVHLAKIHISRKGTKYPKKWRNNMSKNRPKNITIQYSMQGDFIKEWPSLSSIQVELGFEIASISKCCRGKNKTSYGYKWKYKN